MNVLFVDDNEMIVEITKKLLEDCDINLWTALDGDEALKIVQTETIDIIFTDEEMPNMSGTELMKAVKTSFPDIYIVLITAHSSIKSDNPALQFDRIVAKPVIGIDDLIDECVEEMAQKKA